MKRQFVEALQEGDTVNDYFVAIRKDLRTQQNGGKFLGMVFKDKTGEVGGILWNNAPAVAKLFELGDVVNVRGNVVSYQDRLQIRVDQVLPMREDEYSRADLVAVPADTPTLFAEFRTLLDQVENEWLTQLIDNFLDDRGFVERFSAAAAGKKWHHAHPGGLVRHCLEMARLACSACEVFPSIDRDVLLTGVLLHDVGKLDELSQDLYVEYTAAGRLLGHLAIGAALVERKMASIDGFPETLRLQVLHCILAHHGTQDNGSPVVPKTVEALTLYHIDNLGAQVDAFERLIGEAKDRGQNWTDYVPLIDRQVWTKNL
jgi:3'-5' exoribonuclease